MMGMIGAGAAARPPSYWRTIAVENSGPAPLLLTVAFGDNESGHHVINETHTIGTGETFTFPEQQYEEGSWTSVASVHGFNAQCVNGSMLGDRQFFEPHPTAGIEPTHLVHMNCTNGMIGVDM